MSADPRATAADRHTPGHGAEGGEGTDLAAPSQAVAGDARYLPGGADQRPDHAGTELGPATPPDSDHEFAAMLAEGRAAGPGGQPNGFDTALRTPDPGPAPVLAPGTSPVPPGPGDDSEPGGDRPARKRGRGGRDRQGRKVRQRLWAVDPWSVFKISVMFYGCMFIIVLVAGTVLWNVARSAGTIDETESFVTRLAAYGECVPEDEVAKGTEFETDDDCEEGTVLVDGFKIDDGVVFRSVATGGAILAVAGSMANVLMAILLNLINEVSGGMRYTIIREPSGPRPPGRVKRLARSLGAKARR
jgi:hypothetical protein